MFPESGAGCGNAILFCQQISKFIEILNYQLPSEGPFWIIIRLLVEMSFRVLVEFYNPSQFHTYESKFVKRILVLVTNTTPANHHAYRHHSSFHPFISTNSQEATGPQLDPRSSLFAEQMEVLKFGIY